MTIHQFVPTWEPGAIGAHALAIHETLHNAGIGCETWADDVKPGLPPLARSAGEFFADRSQRRGCALLYHTAMGTPTADELVRRGEPLVLDHHNVTPPAYFDAWEPGLAENLEVGEVQVLRLARRAVLGLADSHYNAAELRRAGCRATSVVPVFIDFDRGLDAGLLAKLEHAKRGTAWLFVGRVAPNKAPHDVVRAFAWYRAAFDPAATLWLVGSSGLDRYVGAVARLVEHLGIGAAVTVTGAVSDDQLGAYYAAADVFVCLSAHEGFGVPIVEAMSAGVPVVALGAAAVPETAGSAALVVDRADPGLVAAAVTRVRRDVQLRAALIAAGRARAGEFDRTRTAPKLLDALRPVLATIGAR